MKSSQNNTHSPMTNPNFNQHPPSEKYLMNQIRLECAKRNWIVIRLNVGKFKLDDGRFFDTGIPKGFPDLMILTDFGKTFFIETKKHPNKPSKDQIRTINLLKSKGFNAEIVYNLNQFFNFCLKNA